LEHGPSALGVPQEPYNLYSAGTRLRCDSHEAIAANHAELARLLGAEGAVGVVLADGARLRRTHAGLLNGQLARSQKVPRLWPAVPFFWAWVINVDPQNPQDACG
jgi:hypothetical protein